MKRNRILAAAILSLTFWWGVNSLASVLEGPPLLRSQASVASVLEEKAASRLPIAKDAPAPVLSAQSALALLVRDQGMRVLYEKNTDEVYPIASITKLLAAFVAADIYSPEESISVSPSAVAQVGDYGFLRSGDVFPLQQMLHILLMESSNDAAEALAEHRGRADFISLMREKAAFLGLERMEVTNPTGLDEDNGMANRASAGDVASLFLRLRDAHLDAFAILGTPTADISDADGMFHHTAYSTNILLGDPDFPLKVLAGKTGETELARQTLVVLAEAPRGQGELVLVVLGSQDRFQDMRVFADWLIRSYKWTLPPIW